jgi:hypothetical protein
MRNFLLVLCLILFTSKLFAQQFGQYNTGTLYDSFENPSQASFKPDTSRNMAFNFLVPNFNANFYLKGDAQHTLKDRAINGSYDNSALQIGNGNKFNYVKTNANAYSIMFKVFTSLDGSAEAGFFVQTKLDGRGAFTDESIALLNGSGAFPLNDYTNIFNSKFSYQLYNEFGVTYREQITKQFALGIRLASVSGMSQESVTITQSSIHFDRAADSAGLRLTGTDRQAGSSYLPFSNPGVDVSIGTTYKTHDQVIFQFNLKNLGFIHWNKSAETYDFSGEEGIYDLSTGERETNVYNAVSKAVNNKVFYSSYNTPLDGTFEASVYKSFVIDELDNIRYSPSLIASKELFYNGFDLALVNPIKYNNYSVSLVTSYDNMDLFKFGGQFMIKSDNAEFFIGNGDLSQTGALIKVGLKKQSEVNKTSSFIGTDAMFGFSIKFGSVIEHPMNASYIPMGEKGFLGRIWDKIFKPSDSKAASE